MSTVFTAAPVGKWRFLVELLLGLVTISELGTGERSSALLGSSSMV